MNENRIRLATALLFGALLFEAVASAPASAIPRERFMLADGGRHRSPATIASREYPGHGVNRLLWIGDYIVGLLSRHLAAPERVDRSRACRVDDLLCQVTVESAE